MGLKDIGVVVAIVIVGLIIAVSISNIMDKTRDSSDVTGNSVKSTGKVQVVELTYENYGYKLTPSSVKAGETVNLIIKGDTLPGCMKSVVIPAFGIREYVPSGDKTVQFTPEEPGEYLVTCSMGMGRGTLIVE